MLLLKSRWDQMSDERYTSRVCRLETRLDQLADASYAEPNARRIAKRMGKYRKELTAFLWEKDLEATNNAAERAIRPAVVARKISGGSRSANGAAAFAKLASLLRTAGQQGKNVLATIKGLLMAAWQTGNPAHQQHRPSPQRRPPARPLRPPRRPAGDRQATVCPFETDV